MVHGDPEPPGTRVGQTPFRVGGRLRRETRRPLARSAEPSREPLRLQLVFSRTKPPWAWPEQDFPADAPEAVDGGVHGVRPEKPLAAAEVAALVSVERLPDHVIEGVARQEVHVTGDTQGDQDRTSGSRATDHEPAELLTGQHVEQCRGRDEPGVPELLRRKAGDVALAPLRSDGTVVRGRPEGAHRGDPEQLGIAVDHHPVLWASQLRGQPACHRPGAAPEVVHDQASLGEVAPDLLDQLRRARRGVRTFPQGQPVRADLSLSGAHAPPSGHKRSGEPIAVPSRLHGVGTTLAQAMRRGDTVLTARRFTVLGSAAAMVLVTTLAVAIGMSTTGWLVGLLCGVVLNATLAVGLKSGAGSHVPGAADLITLSRGVIACALAGLATEAVLHRPVTAWFVPVTVVALLLDAVDGWVARRTGTSSAFGGRFDGEVDAFLILVLSVQVAANFGAWVLTAGLMRYVFGVAGWVAPWMRERLPYRYWRKVVTAAQGVVLTAAAADVLPRGVSSAGLVLGLALLSESFGRDVAWLLHERATTRRSRDAAVMTTVMSTVVHPEPHTEAV